MHTREDKISSLDSMVTQCLRAPLAFICEEQLQSAGVCMCSYTELEADNTFGKYYNLDRDDIFGDCIFSDVSRYLFQSQQ